MKHPDICSLFFIAAYDSKTNVKLGDPWDYTAAAYDYDDALEAAAKIQSAVRQYHPQAYVEIRGWEDCHIYGEYDDSKPALDEYYRLAEEDWLCCQPDYRDVYEPDEAEDPDIR